MVDTGASGWQKLDTVRTKEKTNFPVRSVNTARVEMRKETVGYCQVAAAGVAGDPVEADHAECDEAVRGGETELVVGHVLDLRRLACELHCLLDTDSLEAEALGKAVSDEGAV